MCRSILKLSIIIAFLLLPFMATEISAQPSSGGGDPCFPPATPCIPIDGGVGFLIAAGLAYGGKKAYDMRNKGQ